MPDWEHFYCFRTSVTMATAELIANNTKHENDGNTADRGISVNLRGTGGWVLRFGNRTVGRYGVISSNRHMRAVQSGGCELASGACSHARTCTKSMRRPGDVNKAKRSSDYNTQGGRGTSSLLR